jgi:hypothetical protein
LNLTRIERALVGKNTVINDSTSIPAVDHGVACLANKKGYRPNEESGKYEPWCWHDSGETKKKIHSGLFALTHGIVISLVAV